MEQWGFMFGFYMLVLTVVGDCLLRISLVALAVILAVKLAKTRKF